eukprot:Nk52_evm16s914 gene=Nk52_evmTU16s914
MQWSTNEISEEEYKLLKEKHVTGYEGSSVLDIHITLCALVASYICWKMCKSLGLSGNSNVGIRFVMEFVVVIVPAIISVTLTELTPLLLVLLISPYLIHLVVGSGFLYSSGEGNNYNYMLDSFMLKRKPFLEAYRALMMLIVCISILAVDFNVFPRRFVKTENYGFSLMDIGVGCFIVSNGVVLGNRTRNCFSFQKTLSSCAPLVGLGLVRLASVKSANYQEHVSEYGAHWNFFFTLGGVALAYSCISSFVSPSNAAAVGFLTLLLHQYALTGLGVEKYVIEQPRDPSSFVSLNKEGLASLPGYFGLFLAGVQVGNLVTSPCGPSRESAREWGKKVAVKLAIAQWMLWFTLYILVGELGIQPSRRLVNISYAVWTLASNIFFICALLFVDYYTGIVSTDTSVIIPAINFNQLPIFLVANLLTGAINISMYTLFISDDLALVIITAYMGLVCLVACILFHHGILLKFW